MIDNLPYIAVAVMFFLAFYAILFNRNLLRIAIGLSVFEAATNLLLIALGYVNGSRPPIYTFASEGAKMALPTPQALTLTAIVIGLATTALLLSLIMLAFRHYGTLDVNELRRLKG